MVQTKKNTIDRTLRSLDGIINSEYPIRRDKADRHEQKIEFAKRYKEELESVLADYGDVEFSVVAKSTFERVIGQSDFVQVVEMQFVRVANVVSFPDNENKIYIWLTPLQNI